MEMSLYYPLVLAKLLVSLIETFLKNSKSGYRLEKGHIIVSSSLWHEAIKSDATPPMKELLVHPRVVTPSAFCRFLGQFVGNHYCSWLKLVVWQKSFLHKNKTQWPAQPCPILILSIRSLLHWPWGHNSSLSFPELIKMYLLPIISTQYPALMSWEYSKLSLKEIVFVFLI